jgi:hypothetical protein
MASGSTIPVSADNFSRAESDLYFGGIVKDGGLGKFFHIREPTPIDHQTVIRMNRDTLYSGAMFDLDAGPATITLPNAAGRFMSAQVIDEDHYTHDVIYEAGDHTLAKNDIGTRYVVVAIRTLVNPTIRRMLRLSTRCKTPSRSANPAGRARLRFLNGTPPVRRRPATRCSCWRQAFRTARACSERGVRSIRCAT